MEQLVNKLKILKNPTKKSARDLLKSINKPGYEVSVNSEGKGEVSIRIDKKSVPMSLNGSKKHLLFICSGGLDRSPAAEELINEKASDKFEARSCGLYPLTHNNALTKQALRWADIIVVMEFQHKADILERFPLFLEDKPEIVVLDISNEYVRYDPELQKLLITKLKKEGFL